MTAVPSRSRRTSASSPPPPGEAREVERWLVDRTDEMVELLELLARAESPSLDPEAQRAAFALLAQALADTGYRVRAVRGTDVGDHLLARPVARARGRTYQLLVGHLDTVWPLGTVDEMPVRRDGDLLYGPGVLDMKGGLVQAVYALRALAAVGSEPVVTPVLLVTSDEEIGSRDSLRWLDALARGADRALVLESALGSSGRLKTARKGTGRYRVTVRGRAAHAGVSPQEGLSAILELSHVIQQLFALNDPVRGVTVNVGRIDGGLRANVVAPRATALVDVRVPAGDDAHQLDAAIRSLQPTTAGVELEIDGAMTRPPLERTPGNRALWEAAVAAAEAMGLGLEEAAVGGASDANYTSRHTPTLDGLGPVGEGAHAAHEHVVVSRLAERAALLAQLLLLPPLAAR